MALPMSSMLGATGLPDPRQKTREDLMRMYRDYILSGPTAAPAATASPPASASSAPGWGEITAAEDEEEEISEDKGQLIEADLDEEEAPPAPQPLDEAEEEAAEVTAEEETEEPVSSADTYESEILKLLEEARGKILQPKKLSIADILGAGTMRRSAQLIGETEKLNEERQMKAQELALDILMRKSKIQKEREAAQALAKYRQGLIDVRRTTAEKGRPDPVTIQIAKRTYPNLPENEAIQKYLDLIKPKPTRAAPRPTESQMLASLRAKKARGQPMTVEDEQLLKVLEDKINRESALEEAMRNALGLTK